LSQAVSFWLLAVLLVLLLGAASAPSPLYAVYQASWKFSPLTLTVVYAVYAFGALAALLVTGRMSDHVGRRPVVVLGLLILIVAMFVFIAAQGVEALLVARGLQGVGTGISTAAVSAWLLDLQPPDSRQLGGLVGGVAPMAGLGAGALASGLLVQYAPDPMHLVFWLLATVFAAGAFAMFAIPDPVGRRPGWVRSLRPEVAVPANARSLFVASGPSLIALWAIAGLYLSLGPSLAVSLLGFDSRVAGGLVIAALLGTGAVAAALGRATDPRAAAIRGSLLLVGGVAITLVAVAVGSPVGLYIGSIVAGVGFGPAFTGIVRSLSALAPADQRGALFAAIYVAVYLSFSLPAILAGGAVNAFGLHATTYAYGLVVMALAVLTIFAMSRRPVAAA
jgi:predicted MFS family arabinose efflux permease